MSPEDEVIDKNRGSWQMVSICLKSVVLHEGLSHSILVKRQRYRVTEGERISPR